MGELLDRDFQRTLLEQLAYNYPEMGTPEGVIGSGYNSENRIKVNLTYLEGHGLIDTVRPNGIPDATIKKMRITVKGLDFLANDGGLSAILGVVTVKLHEDTLKQLLIDRIQASEDEESVKESAIKAIRKLPAEATKHVAMKAIDAGLANLPKLASTAMNWIQTAQSAAS